MPLSPDGLRLMKLQCLRELTLRVVSIPSNWSTAQVYDALVQDGTAKRLKSDNPMTSKFEITDAGCKFYAENPNPPFNT